VQDRVSHVNLLCCSQDTAVYCKQRPTLLDHPVGSKQSTLVSFKSRLVLPFWYRLTQVVLEKRPSNGCSVVDL